MDDHKFEDTEKDLELTVQDMQEVRERLQNMEFNNEEEDLEMIEEEDFEDDEEVEDIEREKVEEKEEKIEDLDDEDSSKNDVVIEKKEEKEDNFIEEDKNGKTIIILLCCIIVILIFILLLILLPKLNKSNSSNSVDNESTPIPQNEKPTVSKVDISSGDSYFVSDKHLYVISKGKGYITNLEGKTYFQDDSLSCSTEIIGNRYLLCEEKSGEKVKYSVKRVEDDGEVRNVIQEDNFDVSDRILLNDKNQLFGVYKQTKNGLELQVLSGDGSNTVKINDAYLVSSKVYDGRYLIVSKEKEHKTIGVFDIKDNKITIPVKYKEITYLKEDCFAVKDSSNVGIVNKDGSVKLSFRFDKIYYSNGLLFAGTNDIYKLFDSSYKEINSSLPYGITDVTAFGDRVIVHARDNYSTVDKKGSVSKLDISAFYIYEDHLIAIKDNKLLLYGKDYNIEKEFEYNDMNSIDLSTGVIYLDNYLVFNGRKLFDINEGKYLYNANSLSRSYQGYFVNLDIHDTKGDASISLDDKPIGSIKDIDMNDFLHADNNGIRVTNEYFIFHVGNKTLVIKK